MISKELQILVAAAGVKWQQAEYASAILDGFMFVVAATDDRPLNLRIASDAEDHGILSCNVSAASRSRVIFPAVYTDEEITVAVHSHGRQCRPRNKYATKSHNGGWNISQSRTGNRQVDQPGHRVINRWARR